ncbi:hypothetical protein ALQ33_02892 [Pseudomonas syringae pv. philadelphi]|uniref:Uncharacterized protein n=1 Tax=Pseudomonas syringae pv. philadelphi TaxID=251706 RepID=A0A3M3Z0P9_9PSED|nr:hypothetical protein [Pseudomonas syringae group genomosp. 3]RMO88348.1 hypothetical protein ALQ33_02892 [Pseudomonas syringae pv. philadelphi]
MGFHTRENPVIAGRSSTEDVMQASLQVMAHQAVGDCCAVTVRDGFDRNIFVRLEQAQRLIGGRREDYRGLLSTFG